MQQPENSLSSNNFQNEIPVYISTSADLNISSLKELTLGLFGTEERIEISVVVQGEGFHTILEETSECHAGDMYILSNDVSHRYSAKSEDFAVTTLLFDAKKTLPSEFSDPDSLNYCCGVFRDGIPISYAMLNSKALSETRSILAGIRYELEKNDTEWCSAVCAYLTLLLITLGRYINMADTVPILHPKEWGTVSAAIHEIEERCSDSNMTLEAISSTLFISKSHLSRLFQKVLGVSFVEYVRDIRLSRARKLLTTTNLTNEDIVKQCGLKDIPSFYKLFKSATSMTPYQYRISQSKNKFKYKGEKTMSIINEISENLQKCKAKIVKELVEKAIADGVPAVDILNQGLLDGMNVIGEKFKNNEIYVPEVLVAARAMDRGMQVIKPLLIEDGVQAKGKVCIGTVQGDLHDIGKNLVKMMLEGKGLEVVDLGTDVSPETFVQTAIDQGCQVICSSALLTTTMDVMADVVKVATEKCVRDKVKIMVGGAPVTDEFCKKIGADCYTSDAASAANAAVELCK
ncbi:MAG: cobalamin-dependent protein [Clostridia bacterium]|nr:cobalamin-dependent protein [Clostridia bacterium]